MEYVWNVRDELRTVVDVTPDPWLNSSTENDAHRLIGELLDHRLPGTPVGTAAQLGEMLGVDEDTVIVVLAELYVWGSVTRQAGGEFLAGPRAGDRFPTVRAAVGMMDAARISARTLGLAAFLQVTAPYGCPRTMCSARSRSATPGELVDLWSIYDPSSPRSAGRERRERSEE